MKKPRFTLTELLVVTGIVATIACLALPIGTQMRENGMKTQEVYNLRQLGSATSAYAADHNDQIFSSATPGGWPSVLYSKYGSVLADEPNGVSNWKMFKSPFDKRPDKAESASGQGVPVSYGINVNVLTQSATGGNAFDGKINKFTSPDQLVLMAPNVDLTQSLLVFIPGTGDTNVALNVPRNPPATSSENRGTHAKRSQITILFADYHTADIKYRAFATASGADGAARWQPIHHP